MAKPRTVALKTAEDPGRDAAMESRQKEELGAAAHNSWNKSVNAVPALCNSVS
jgi:hypothetical protein